MVPRIQTSLNSWAHSQRTNFGPANGFWFLRSFPGNIPLVCADLYRRAWLYGHPAIWKEITPKICVDASDGARKKKKKCARCCLLTMWIEVFANIIDHKIDLTTTMFFAIYSLFFFFLICLSLILRQKLDRISGEFGITECELCEVRRLKKKGKN